MEPSSLKIRPALHADMPSIIDFQLKMALETEDLKLDKLLLEKGVQAVLSDRHKGFYLIAEKDSRAVASLLITFEWSDWRNGLVWWIQSVYVLPGFRDQKVFSAMYAYVKDMVLRNDSIRGLRLYVDKRNVKAQRVYEKLGMNGEHYAMYEWMKD